MRLVRERPSRHDELAETVDVPRERLGRLALLGGGCRRFCPGDVSRPATLSSSSFVGVGTGIESWRYCSVGMSVLKDGRPSSDIPPDIVPGWNSIASGLKEKW